METRDVDYLYSAVYYHDKATLCKYADLVVDAVFAEEEIYDIIMKKIEQDDCYEYFFDLLKKGNSKLICFMKYSTKINDIKICIENRESFKLTDINMVELILATKDERYIKKCIENWRNLELSVACMKKIILRTGDIDFIKWAIANSKYLKFNYEEIEELSLLVEEKVIIDLPETMTVGIEIESEGKESGEKIARILELSNEEWECGDDATLLKNGLEVVSPILTNDFKECSREIRSVCAVLNGFEQNISDRCGGHIHIGDDYLTSVQDYKNLIDIWSNAEKVLYIISNEKGIIPRDGVVAFAQPISRKIEDSLEVGAINLDNENDLDKFVYDLCATQEDRYSGINFNNIGYENKNTIEFRLSNGTLNPNTWIENINLFGGIVKVAHDLSIIQSKPEKQRNKEEKEKLQYFELIKKEGNDGDQEIVLKALLQLCVSKNQIQTYIDRYDTNKPLMESNSRLNEELDAIISKKTIEMVKIK